MSRLSISLGLRKNADIAREVIESAKRILGAAGFDQEEISKIFLDASSISTNSPVHLDMLEEPDVLHDEEYPEDRRYKFEEEFERLDCVRALERLAKRHERQWNYESSVDAAAALEGFTEALPLANQAQNWLVQNAASANMEVGGLRDSWVETASDHDLDNEDRFIFFDDWRYGTRYSWDIGSSLAKYYVSVGDTESVFELAQTIATSGVALPQRVIDEVAEAVEAVGQYSAYEDFVLSLTGAGEQMRSEVNDNYALSNGINGTHLLDQWLDSISQNKSNVSVYKRSNRWRFEVS